MTEVSSHGDCSGIDFKHKPNEASYSCSSVDRPEDMVEHTVEVCPVWVEHRRVLLEAINGGDLSFECFPRHSILYLFIIIDAKMASVNSIHLKYEVGNLNRTKTIRSFEFIHP